MRSGGKGNWWNIISMMFPMGPNGQSGGVNFKPFRGEAASEMNGVPAYWSLLNTILHAVCLIDPNETGFESHTTQSSSLQGSRSIHHHRAVAQERLQAAAGKAPGAAQ